MRGVKEGGGESVGWGLEGAGWGSKGVTYTYKQRA